MMRFRNDEFIRTLDPDIFSHGRLLRRFPGSDACRFSARVALNLLERVDDHPRGSRPRILWDPFCGAGMIPCVALAAFPGKFDVVVASDINGEAVACALENLNIVCDSAAFAARRAQIHKSRGMNQGMDRRGAIIESYMAELEPILMTNPAAVTIGALRGDAFRLPAVSGDVHFVADLPHGNQSQLLGGPLSELLPSLRSAFPDATATFVTTRDAVEQLCHSTPGVQLRDLAHGRVVVRL